MGRKLKPRDYQDGDVAAVLEAHKTHQCVLGRGATGLGKAVELAMLAKHYSQFGRVMTLVDVTKLVKQLAATYEWVIGVKPGIEMADSRASNDGLHGADNIVISTVQTQYSGGEGNERFRQFSPSEFSVLLLDECELFLAPKARSVVDWYIKGNPSIRVYGTTATPIRTDGVAMANLFEVVAFDHDILWGIENGWLVPARQAFVRVALDFSTLTVRPDEEGDRDYSAEELASQLMANEQALIELAKGIVHVSESRRTIIVCPNVESAKAIAGYIESEKPGQARCIYGELDDAVKDELFSGHQRGDFQFLSSVMMLTKGYDDPEVSCVVNCRKTRSKRLYTQTFGRGTRPLRDILEGLVTPQERREAIAASSKENMLMVNMIGIDADTRDITIADILGQKETDATLDRAKQLMLEGMETEDAIELAKAETETADEAASYAAEAAAKALDAADEADLYREARKLVQVDATIDVEYTDDLRMGSHGETTGIEPRHLAVLQRNKVPEKTISKLTPDQAKDLTRKIISRHKAGLCTFRQASVLQRNDYSRSETERMTKDQAKAAIDELAANKWRRPERVA